jgi:flagellar hook assembly protein FlgD
VSVISQPNPLTGSTTIRYAVPAEGRVIVEIYDINGRNVATLVDAKKPAGFHEVAWNGRDETGSTAASGMYFCVLKVENEPRVMEKLIKL